MTVELSTGTLDLFVDGDVDIDAFCDVAARANPRRGFLIVSRVLGRHLPARPGDMRATMDGLAARVGSDLPGPIVFLASDMARYVTGASLLVDGGLFVNLQ